MSELVYLHHVNEDSNPPEFRRFPFATTEEAETQGNADLEAGLSVDGVFDARGTKVMTPKGKKLVKVPKGRNRG